MFIGPCIVEINKEENQLDATQYFIALVISSTCFGHHYAHHQELATITTAIVQQSSARTLSQPPCT
jgi:hypothetical protein